MAGTDEAVTTEQHQEGEAASEASSPPRARKPLGQLAVDAGLITPQQLASAFAEISGSGKRLGEVLVARKWVDQHQLDRLLAHQARLGPAPAETDGDREHEGDTDTATNAAEAPAETARDLDDLVAEVERRAAAVRLRAGREAELEARLTESETLLQLRDDDIAVARQEIEHLTQQLAERDQHDASIRAALERVTQQLTDRDAEA